MKRGKRLDDSIALEKRTTQASGPLYDLYIAAHEGRIERWHHYFDVYERHLSRYRGTPARMLEIGVQRGGSLTMWSTYFGDRARIVGIDIDPEVAGVADGLENVSIRIGNQRDTVFLAEVEAEFGPFDIIIDDGGHMATQQIDSFNALYPNMTPEGVYICEDTHTAYWDNYKDAGGDISFLTYTKKLIDVLHAPFHSEDLFLHRYDIRPEDRDGVLFTNRFAAETKAILVYDSMVVFERAPRAEPFRDVR